MKQKTPMQEFIDDLQHTADNFKINNEKDKAVHASLIVTVGIAQSLLEKEKEVIETAFWEGRIIRPLTSEQWYNETFKNKK